MMEVVRLSNSNGMELEVNNYGATLMALKVPGLKKKLVNVVLGLDAPEDYANPEYHKHGIYLGCSVGRFAGRISNGSFKLEGKEYALDPTDKVHLHGGKTGWDKKYWNFQAVKKGKNPSVVLSLSSRHLEGGYPGNVESSVEYKLTESNALRVRYTATTDLTTIINLTNHSYYNLDGEGGISNHFLQLASNKLLALDESKIPTGDILDGSKSPFDFTKKPRIKDQLIKGLDDVFVFSEKGEHAVFLSTKSGIQMKVFSQQPAMVVFTPERLPNLNFRDKKVFGDFPGICFETQNYPDAPNHPHFPSCILRNGETYTNEAIFDFSLLQ